MNMAYRERNPKGPVLFHSDQGIEYLYYPYREHVEQLGLIRGVSKRDNC